VFALKLPKVRKKEKYCPMVLKNMNVYNREKDQREKHKGKGSKEEV